MGLSIALPKKIEFQPGDGPQNAKVIVEPLHPGYGITLGNSIRRVLLSSLPGAAPIGVKIKGVDHEFMALPHVKEDILEIILKLKNLRLRVFSDEVVKLDLNVHGKKNVTAADFTKNSDVEIINTDLDICTITDISGSISMELFVSRGMGYETIESREQGTGLQRKTDKEIGYIEMDSIFSPIVKIGVDIENVRVGKMTNWDRLVIDIVTDGTITPEEAFRSSVDILIKQFSALSETTVPEGEEDIDKGAVSEEKAEKAEEPEKSEVKIDEGEANEPEAKKKRGRPKKKE